ncbi:hypothetical protein DYE48_19660 [Halobacillus trueperi]|uniref:IstB-like ATP-binding domain-containing protein n=1 Tax=Halobacillus trueperi TaxID=156205 RepID=A0A3E0IZK5_9BACI|nr:hypothetical protein DYE48_19660 [Halobacillus trueperi]
MDEKRIKEVLTGRYIHHGNIILLVPTGVGKTYIATSMTVEVLTQGPTALYITGNDFIAECQNKD